MKIARPDGLTIFMEDQVGLEPTTPCLKGRCSNQLSYGSIAYKDTTLKGNLSMLRVLWHFKKQQIEHSSNKPDCHNNSSILNKKIIDRPGGSVND